MLIYLSHALALIALSIAALYDLKSGEVPDIVFLTAISFGIVLHRIQSLVIESYEPLMWSLGLGILFFAYGWLAYLRGMWGGADALALAVLGFATPIGFSQISYGHAADLVFNLMIAILVYSILFVLWKTINSDGFYRKLYSSFKDNKERIGLEISLISVFSLFLHSVNLNGWFYFSLLLFMVVLYRFLLVAENNVFTETVSVEDLEGGEVLAEDYSDKKIKGASLEEIANLDVDEVQIRDGVKLVPVFPIALVLTDLNLLGISVFISFVS